MRVVLTLPDDSAAGQWGVYVLCDAAGEPLYIGQSMNLHQRLKSHRSTPWWRQVRTLDWTPCVGASEAQTVEREMIAVFESAVNQNGWTHLRPGRNALPGWAAENVRTLYDEAKAEGPDSPADRQFKAYCAALLAAGWSLASIGYPMMLTREAIRRHVLRAVPVKSLPQVPPVPPKPVKTKPKRVRPCASDAVVAEMRALHAFARHVNGGTPADDPRREASERLTELLAEQWVEGVSVYQLSKHLDVTHNAIRTRLSRHGYKEPSPSNASQVYLGHPTEHVRSDTCFQGHPLAGDNLRLVNGDPNRRACRTCAYLASQRYKRRKATAAVP